MKEDTASKILQKLKEQKKEEGGLPLLLEFYHELLQVQSDAQKHLGSREPTLSSEAIRKRTQAGLPLVGFDELALDWVLVPELFAKVLATFAKYPQLFGEIPQRLREPAASDILTKAAVEAWFNGKELPPAILDVSRENLVPTIIQATIQPFLAACSNTLIDSVEQDFWRRGYCPICGGSPDLAFLKKDYGARWLLCSRCDSEWLFQRLECPYCGTNNQDELAFFTDDEGRYRLYVCEKCKCYLKAVDLRKIESDVLLPLERLNTLDLDAQAKEYGYSPCQTCVLKIK